MLAVLVLGVSAEPAAAQANYTYTVIDDLSDCYSAGAPALGNNGEAAFFVQCGAGNGVRKGDGVTSTSIYTYRGVLGDPYSIPDSVVSINDLGFVAFSGAPTGGGSTGYSILYGNGGPLTVVTDTSVQTQWEFVLRPSINNSQAVAFMAASSGAGSYNTVIRADGATFTTIAQPGMSAPGAGTIHQAFEPALNNGGQVEFSVNTLEGVPGIFRGSGGVLTKIVLGGAAGSFAGINDGGRIAFPVSGHLVQSGTGGKLTTIASAGGVFHHVGLGVAAINNSNAVAFWAQTQAGPSGVFVGDGIATQPVLQTGDVLPELGTVTWVGISEEAINDHGQVAFALQYDDGVSTKSAIVRADPILPQITQIKLAATVAGCKTASASVLLDRAAPPGGVVIDIDETNPAASAPTTLKIASNKTSGKFVVSTIPVSAKQTGTVTATLASSTQTKSLAVRPMGVQSVSLSPNPVVGGNGVTGTVTLECAAAPGDITVALSSKKPEVAQPAVPSLLFAAGTQTMTFQVDTSAVTANAIAKIAAKANGITKSKGLTVTP
ncbi:MAG TPA: hypothetical protein VMO26_26565 [Vicinamibacterales bacterium]|nr:hypothetical protein [Vicinamibacterales bacterium]